MKTSPNLTKVTVCGGGKVGRVVALLLSDCGDYRVTVIDKEEKALARFKDRKNIETKSVDMSDQKAVEKAAKGTDFIISTAPFFLTINIARAAKKVGAHYVDLTEDVEASDIIRDLAKDAETAFIPQSGLAPGFISIAAYHVTKNFDELDEVRLRVGALAKYPNNAIKYNLSWSTAGLINEYCHPCNAILDGEYKKIEPLEGYEHFTLDGVNYECFNTSGGLGTLHETLAGKVRSLTYKSVRYPGHLDIMRFLINDLKMKYKQQDLVDILDEAIPYTTQDVVLVYVEVSGMKSGKHVQETYAVKVYEGNIIGDECAAIQITTAGSACAVIDLVREGKLPQKGYIKQEDIDFNDFITNRFGRVFAPGEITARSV